MKKVICIKGFSVEKYGNNGEFLEEYETIEDNSIWSIQEDNYRFIGSKGSISLENEEDTWLELEIDTFKLLFKFLE